MNKYLIYLHISIFLYAEDIIIDFDHQKRILMNTGLIQGLMSSTLFYAGGKWDIQKQTKNDIIQSIPNFNTNFQTDYVDDGVIMIKYQYIPTYINCIQRRYLQWDIKINIHKTEIIIANRKYKTYSIHPK
jgi:hypothetical protein